MTKQVDSKANFNWSSIGWDTGKFLSGMFLIPWVFVVAMYVISSSLVFYLLNLQDESFLAEAQSYFTSIPDLFEVWYVVGLFCFLNYTLAFVFRRTYFRLQGVFIATSFFLQVILLLIIVPFLRIVLRVA
jgi:hypothetical protein